MRDARQRKRPYNEHNNEGLTVSALANTVDQNTTMLVSRRSYSSGLSTTTFSPTGLPPLSQEFSPGISDMTCQADRGWGRWGQLALWRIGYRGWSLAVTAVM